MLLEQWEFQEHVAFAFAAKALACQLAVQTSLENGWRQVMIEGDTLSIIKKCQSKSMDKSQVGPLIENKKQMSNFFQIKIFLRS